MKKIIDVTNTSDKYSKLFTELVRLEVDRRVSDINERNPELNEFEKTYFGAEVGYMRRCFNKIQRSIIQNFLKNVKTKSLLLDFGCGGTWWKDSYWPLFDNVDALEVNEVELKLISAKYPEVNLLLTRNGLIKTDKKYDVVLSSSVIGYMMPVQAEKHIQNSFQVLKEGGLFICTRVAPFVLGDFIRSQRFYIVDEFSFLYKYKKFELIELLKRNKFRDIKYISLGIQFPFFHRTNQFLYKHFPFFMTRVMPFFFPFFRVQHMVIAIK